jgi:hypothetical protein
VVNQPSTRPLSVYGLTPSKTMSAQATKIVYSTMTRSDMTLYQVGVSYRYIREKSGIEALTLSSAHPTTNLAIEVISGYWSKGYRCSIDGFVHQIKEDRWNWEDSIRYSKTGCETIPGTSGSPILEAGTRKVIGVNNTGNEDGLKCTMNNPCEVDEKGNITYAKGTNYGQQTYWIYSCLNAAHELDLTVKGCQLPH